MIGSRPYSINVTMRYSREDRENVWMQMEDGFIISLWLRGFV